MQQFVVPQFIDVEDKILGPLTVRQFLIMLVSCLICFLGFPALVILVLLAPVLVEVIPKYIKWSPALFALSIISVTSALAAVTTPLTNTLNAIGKISVTFKLMIMWTALTWIFVPLLAFLYGLNGVAVGFTLVGLSSFVALYIVAGYVTINYFQSAGKPLLGSILMGILVFFVRNALSVSLQQIIILVAIGSVSYVSIMLLIEPKLIPLIKNLIGKK